jgi:hypothetical protein
VRILLVCLSWLHRFKGATHTSPAETSFDADDCRPCLIIFDILYLKANGHVQRLLTQPLYRRKKLLTEVFTPRKGVIEIAEVTKYSTAQDISNQLKYILETRCVDLHDFLLLLQELMALQGGGTLHQKSGLAVRPRRAPAVLGQGQSRPTN